MRTATISRTDGVIVCKRCVVARSALSRMKGLLGRSYLPESEGILLEPATSIHMFFMRFPLDAVFLDPEMTVLRILPSLRPWRTAARRGARSVLELPAGTCRRVGLNEGDRLRVDQ